MSEPVSVFRAVSAPAQTVWALVSDVTRMGQWSPETRSCRWLRGATAAALGASFQGSNRNRNRRWKTSCTIDECEPGKSFGFYVHFGPKRLSHWSYRFEETNEGTSCVVTESMTNFVGPRMSKMGGMISGVSDRSTHNRATMTTTLANLAAAAEGGSK